MAAIAFLAVSLGLIQLNSDTTAHHFRTYLRVDFPSTTTLGRNGDLFAPQRMSELTSSAVLDATLTDAHLSTLPRLYSAADPRRELRRMIQVQRDHRAGVVWIGVEGYLPAEPIFAAKPLAEAILSKGPPGARVALSTDPMRMPLSPDLLDRGWKVAVATFVMILATIAILFLPAGSGSTPLPQSERLG
jgi:hypothetical protein